MTWVQKSLARGWPNNAEKLGGGACGAVWWRHLVGRHAREAGTAVVGAQRDGAGDDGTTRGARGARGASEGLRPTRSRAWRAFGLRRARRRGVARWAADRSCVRSRARSRPPSARSRRRGCRPDPGRHGGDAATRAGAGHEARRGGLEQAGSRRDPHQGYARGTATTRRAPPRHPPPLGRSSRAALGEPRKSPGRRAPTPPTDPNRDPDPLSGPRSLPLALFALAVVYTHRPGLFADMCACVAAQNLRVLRADVAHAGHLRCYRFWVVDAATSGKLEHAALTPVSISIRDAVVQPGLWPRWHSEDAAARAAALRRSSARGEGGVAPRDMSRSPGFSETSRSRSSRARWTSINSERERCRTKNSRLKLRCLAGTNAIRRGASRRCRAVEDVAAEGAAASDVAPRSLLEMARADLSAHATSAGSNPGVDTANASACRTHSPAGYGGNGVIGRRAGGCSAPSPSPIYLGFRLAARRRRFVHRRVHRRVPSPAQPGHDPAAIRAGRRAGLAVTPRARGRPAPRGVLGGRVGFASRAQRRGFRPDGERGAARPSGQCDADRRGPETRGKAIAHSRVRRGFRRDARAAGGTGQLSRLASIHWPRGSAADDDVGGRHADSPGCPWRPRRCARRTHHRENISRCSGRVDSPRFPRRVAIARRATIISFASSVGVCAARCISVASGTHRADRRVQGDA